MDYGRPSTSSFNQLYEASVNKEMALTSTNEIVNHFLAKDTPPANKRASSGKRKGKNKNRATVTEQWRALSADQHQAAPAQPSEKWLWGIDLTEEDLGGLVRGADHNFVLPHTGYDESLDDRSIASPSPPVTLAGDTPFFKLSNDIMEAPDLQPDNYPIYLITPDINHLGGPVPAPSKSKKRAGAVSQALPVPDTFTPLPLPPKSYVGLPVPTVYMNAPSEIEEMAEADFSDVRSFLGEHS
jgi:hypothetical protein